MVAQPTRIGSYEIIRPLGKGGMGAVYLGRDPAIDRLVAVKLLGEGLDSPEFRERFLREARAAGRLRHPNIVIIFHVGEHESLPYIVMEYVPGDTLATIIQQRAPLTLIRKLKTIEDLCGGLAYLHKAGIVHRDIKPANVMLDSDGSVKILDFGIARTDEQGLTRSGTVVGTPSYMSPEQLQFGRADSRSDEFAVGLVLYELLTNKRAFSGDTFTVMHNILHGEPEPIERFCPDIDPEITPIVSRALQKQPDARYQDLEMMRAELVRLRERLMHAGSDARLPTTRPILQKEIDAEQNRRHSEAAFAPTVVVEPIAPSVDMPVAHERGGTVLIAAASPAPQRTAEKPRFTPLQWAAMVALVIVVTMTGVWWRYGPTGRTAPQSPAAPSTSPEVLRIPSEPIAAIPSQPSPILPSVSQPSAVSDLPAPATQPVRRPTSVAQDVAPPPGVQTSAEPAVQPPPVQAPSPQTSAPLIPPTLAETPLGRGDSQPAPPPPGPNPPRADAAPADRVAIAAVLQRYVDAYQRKDPEGIREVWPSMPTALSRELVALTRYKLVLTDQVITLTGTDTARVTCIRHIAIQAGAGREQTATPRTTMSLRRIGTGWIIAEIQ